MSLVVSSWARTIFSGQFQLAYQEANNLTNDRFAYKYNPGTTSCVDPFISNRRASHNSSTLTNTSTTETSVTTTVDDILVTKEFVPDYAINTNGGELPGIYARKLGAGLASTRELILSSFIAKNAVAAGNTQIFDSEDTTGSAIFDACNNALVEMRRANIPMSGVTICLDHKRANLLRKYAPYGSRDYTGGANDNTQLRGPNLFGAEIIPMNGCFSLDTTVAPYSSEIASKYQFDGIGSTSDDTSLLGIVFHQDAVRLLELMQPTIEVTPWAVEQAQLVTARCHFGTSVLRTAGIWAIYGDADNT